MKFVDLFCGIGGASYGALKAGLEPLLLVDSESKVRNLLAPQLSKHFLQYDLTHLETSVLENSCDADVLMCSPPCQNFSRLKTRNLNPNVTDDDAAFAKSISQFISSLNPRVFILENVPSFLKCSGATQVIQSLLRMEMHVTAGIYNASNFGVPQRRKRAIILGTRRPKKLFPISANLTVRDAFSRLPTLNSQDPLHQSHRNHSAVVRERIASIPKNGGSRNSLPDHLVLDCHKRSNGYKDIYGRMAWDVPAPTITSGCTNPSKGRFIHPEENRAITLREAARLQTLPDEMNLSALTSNEGKAKAIGNAFPSEMIFQILKQLA